MGDQPSLLDVARAIAGKAPEIVLPEPPKVSPRTRADEDYVSPTAREIEEMYEELVALRELIPPKNFEFPAKTTKKDLVAAILSIDPRAQIAERATLHRMLRSKKIHVPPDTPTPEMVKMALDSGAFGHKGDKP